MFLWVVTPPQQWSRNGETMTVTACVALFTKKNVNATSTALFSVLRGSVNTSPLQGLLGQFSQALRSPLETRDDTLLSEELHLVTSHGRVCYAPCWCLVLLRVCTFGPLRLEAATYQLRSTQFRRPSRQCSRPSIDSKTRTNLTSIPPVCSFTARRVMSVLP